VVFAHRPPAALRFAAYSASALDVAFGIALLVMGAQGPQGRGLEIGGAILLLGSGLPPWILLGVRYEIESGTLSVRRGPMIRRIPLERIEEARISTPLPGVSGVIVSHRAGPRLANQALYPEEAEEFLRQICAGAPQLEVVAEGALRKRA
jgi:hypothetical protein